MQILLATEVILCPDVAMDSRLLSPKECALCHHLKKKFLGLASLDRTLAQQRSRVLWLREGDACTRFFHTHASHRRRKNFIGHLMVDGQRLTDHVDKVKAMDSFFEDLLGTSVDRPFSLDLDYLGIPSINLSEIDGEFTMEEVRNSIKGMPLDKFPSPDGFLARFFVVCWDIVKVDSMAAFNLLLRLDSHGFGAVNSAFITLLPKRLGAQEVKYFRPISLIHGVTKWVAKVIANRLAPSSHSWWDLTRVPLCTDVASMITS
jgi:mannosylglycoprotein endo-beta-mannosidase